MHIVYVCMYGVNIIIVYSKVFIPSVIAASAGVDITPMLHDPIKKKKVSSPNIAYYVERGSMCAGKEEKQGKEKRKEGKEKEERQAS